MIWDLENDSHEFVDIPSEYSYLDISINSLEDIENNKEILNNY